jgi:hypothetical protein
MRVQHSKLYLAIMIFMALMSTPMLSTRLFAQDDYNQNQGGGDPPGRVARLGYVSGNVSFQPSGEDQWSQALPNYPLTTGDRIYTDRDGRAELETGNIAVRLSYGTDVSTTNLTDQLVQLGLAQGTLRVRAYDILSGNSVEIDTPNAALTLLRPGSYRVETYPDDNSTLVTVNSGDLEISGNGLSQVLHSGQSVKLTGGDQDDVQMDWVSALGGDDFDRWSNDRDRRYLSSNSRQYVGNYVPGYSDLDEYGRWEPAPEYGQVWYPSNVSADWAPYRHGRWAWVEPWGWTWVEEEPWGFAPFHYGRWALIGSRWGWVPGTVVVGVRPVYAPALVAFVGGPNASVQVWFPLGPRDPYLPWYHHSDGYLRQVNVINVRNVNIVNVTNIRNVENIHYTYQRVAPTAVSNEVFRGGRPVARETVRVDVNAIGRARVIPHPDVRPDVRAIHAGTPDAHPPVERTRPRVGSRRPVVTGNRDGRQGNDRGGPERSQGNNRQDNGRNPDNRPAVNDRAQGNDRNDRRPDENRSQSNDRGQGNDRAGSPDKNRARETAHNPPPDVRQSPPAGGTGRDFPGRDNPSGNPDNRNQDRGRPTPENTRPAEVRRTPPPSPGQNPPAGGNGRDFPGRDDPGSNADNRNDNRGRGDAGGPPQDRRPLVTKTPPPPQNPPFTQRQAPLQQHPGRPLEPQQVDNIRRGQPAGQMHDREAQPHRDAAPAQQPRQQEPQQKNPPSQHNDDRGKGRDKDKDKLKN